jgi:uracil-DNA glycosylase
VPTLLDIEAEARTCVRCPLSEGRTQVVFGVGDPNADLMFVGEAPGREEDLKGEPFVGRAGKLLDQLVLEEMGLTRDRFYIGNVLKCLRYDALVQLGDGSWERIGRLVRSRYDGDVMSVDSRGNLVSRPVIGWHTSPLAGRRVFRLNFHSAKRAGTGWVNVELTGDHPVLTDDGYVPVEQLVAGARIATGQGLSRLAKDVVYGTLLGDGNLSRTNAHLTMAHSAKEADYALFKADLLAELAPSVDRYLVAAVAGGQKRQEVVSVRTSSHRALWTVRNEFYFADKEVPPWIAHDLNPRMLAIWFMDDGHLGMRPPRQPSAEIATCCFTAEDLTILRNGLARLGLDAIVRAGRLHFNVFETRRLSEMIAPFVPPTMRYKLHPDAERDRPFDPTLFKRDTPEVLFDEVDLVETTNLPRTDTTFFCIDVDETHNFVTAGGVVHNCRPPGNRDPKPEEIESCRPYLETQIELIDPSVIVTLGNFATKLLLNTTQGITKVRGQTYPYGKATLVPTFHPSAALQGGGGDVISKMRADLVRAKRELTAC